MNERERAYNKERFKNMNKKEKMSYIWEYYRWHIIGGIGGTVMTVSLLMTIFGPGNPVYTTDILITGIMHAPDEELQEDNLFFNEELDANVNAMPGNYQETNQMTIANEQLLMIRMVAKEADIMILPEVKYQIFAEQENGGNFYALDELPGLENILETYEEDLVYGANENGGESVYGIRIDELVKVPSITLGEELIFTIFLGAKDLDHTIGITKYLLED